MKLFDSVQQGDGKLNLSAIFSPSSSPACLSINSVARTKGGTMARSWPHKMSRWIGMTQDEAQHGALSTHPNEISKKRANIPRFFDLFIRDCRFSLQKSYAKPRGLHWHCIWRVNGGGCLKLAVALLKDVPRLFFWHLSSSWIRHKRHIGQATPPMTRRLDVRRSLEELSFIWFLYGLYGLYMGYMVFILQELFLSGLLPRHAVHDSCKKGAVFDVM